MVLKYVKYFSKMAPLRFIEHPPVKFLERPNQKSNFTNLKPLLNALLMLFARPGTSLVDNQVKKFVKQTNFENKTTEVPNLNACSLD